LLIAIIIIIIVVVIVGIIVLFLDTVSKISVVAIKIVHQEKGFLLFFFLEAHSIIVCLCIHIETYNDSKIPN
jgi:hypothetical protein